MIDADKPIPYTAPASVGPHNEGAIKARGQVADALTGLISAPRTRALSLAITKLEEARMWLGVAAFDGG